mgnify:CR=1 FL=1
MTEGWSMCTLAPSSLAEWVGAGANFLVAVIAVGVVVAQQRFERRRERERLAVIGASALAHGITALDLVAELQAALDDSPGSSSFNSDDWRFRLGIAQYAMTKAINQELRDPEVIRALIEAQAWLDLVVDHLKESMWLWARLPNSADARAVLRLKLQGMSRDCVEMLS